MPDLLGKDTIVALSTPEGKSALGVIRLSGQNAWTIVNKILRKQANFTHRSVEIVQLVDESGEPLDQAVLIPWEGPSSYTGENMIELSCHGNPLLLHAIEQRLIASGARMAEPGEFTKRAFLNGKLSLDQAEAVALTIEAKTLQTVRSAQKLLHGEMRNTISSLQELVKERLAIAELGLDFIEEDYEIDSPAHSIEVLADIQQRINQLLQQDRLGSVLRNGVQVLIAGPPNVGKSTLLNRIVGYNRAITSDTPGTTRDFLDVTIDLKGLPVTFIDTAGIRDTQDPVEREGTQRAQALFERADIVVWMFSKTEFLPLDTINLNHDSILYAQNKCDLGLCEAEDDNAPWINSAFPIVAINGDGVQQLVEEIRNRIVQGNDLSEIILLEQRHADLLKEASDSIERSIELFETSNDLLLIATELQTAYNCLGSITGSVTSDDILSHIFTSFCIGK